MQTYRFWSWLRNIGQSWLQILSVSPRLGLLLVAIPLYVAYLGLAWLWNSPWKESVPILVYIVVAVATLFGIGKAIDWLESLRAGRLDRKLPPWLTALLVTLLMTMLIFATFFLIVAGLFSVHLTRSL